MAGKSTDDPAKRGKVGSAGYEEERMGEILRCFEEELRRCFSETGKAHFVINCALIKPNIVRVEMNMGTVYTFTIALDEVPERARQARRPSGSTGLADRVGGSH